MQHYPKYFDRNFSRTLKFCVYYFTRFIDSWYRRSCIQFPENGSVIVSSDVADPCCSAPVRRVLNISEFYGLSSHRCLRAIVLCTTVDHVTSIEEGVFWISYADRSFSHRMESDRSYFYHLSIRKLLLVLHSLVNLTNWLIVFRTVWLWITEWTFIFRETHQYETSLWWTMRSFSFQSWPDDWTSIGVSSKFGKQNPFSKFVLRVATLWSVGAPPTRAFRYFVWLFRFVWTHILLLYQTSSALIISWLLGWQQIGSYVALYYLWLYSYCFTRG